MIICFVGLRLVICDQRKLKVHVGGFDTGHLVKQGLGLQGVAHQQILVGHEEFAVLVIRKLLAKLAKFGESLILAFHIHQQGKLLGCELRAVALKRFYAGKGSKSRVRVPHRLIQGEQLGKHI